ncbi:hypothetical protein [Bartonella gliris]|uniref:hypothetical protein n=1 Tax=Bartonella gliris TaxID=3004109 RepID=UPI0038739160
MFFLHLYCKKENLLPFTTWFFLSSFGMLLASNLEARAYLIKQSQASNIVKTNTLDPQNKCDQLNVTTTETEKFITLRTAPILPIHIFQDILALNLFLIAAIVICIRLGNFQIQYFTNKRAPPLT